jgi:hypothetical protein
MPVVAKVAKTFGWSVNSPKLLASFATESILGQFLMYAEAHVKNLHCPKSSAGGRAKKLHPLNWWTTGRVENMSSLIRRPNRLVAKSWTASCCVMSLARIWQLNTPPATQSEWPASTLLLLLCGWFGS